MREVGVVLTEMMIYFLLNKTNMEPSGELQVAHESAHTSVMEWQQQYTVRRFLSCRVVAKKKGSWLISD